MLRPRTFPPVQKYFCPSLDTRPRNSRSLAELSRLIGLIPLLRQNDSPPPWVKEEQPSLQLIRYPWPWNWWLGWFPPPHPPPPPPPLGRLFCLPRPRLRPPPNSWPRNPNWGEAETTVKDTRERRRMIFILKFSLLGLRLNNSNNTLCALCWLAPD